MRNRDILSDRDKKSLREVAQVDRALAKQALSDFAEIAGLSDRQLLTGASVIDTIDSSRLGKIRAALVGSVQLRKLMPELFDESEDSLTDEPDRNTGEEVRPEPPRRQIVSAQEILRTIDDEPRPAIQTEKPIEESPSVNELISKGYDTSWAKQILGPDYVFTDKTIGEVAQAVHVAGGSPMVYNRVGKPYLGPIERILMKLEGASYSEIAKKADTSPGYMSQWFMKLKKYDLDRNDTVIPEPAYEDMPGEGESLGDVVALQPNMEIDNEDDEVPSTEGIPSFEDLTLQLADLMQLNKSEVPALYGFLNPAPISPALSAARAEIIDQLLKKVDDEIGSLETVLEGFDPAEEVYFKKMFGFVVDEDGKTQRTQLMQHVDLIDSAKRHGRNVERASALVQRMIHKTIQMLERGRGGLGVAN